MAENLYKVKLLKLYELLRRETDDDHPISRKSLCERLNKMGISSNVRTLSKDVAVLCENGFEVISYMKDREKQYFVPEHSLSIPELKVLIDAVHAASFITEKKTGELVEKIAALGGSHRAELLKKNMVRFNTRKHTNEAVLYTIDSIENAIARRKQIAFNYFHMDFNGERVYAVNDTGKRKRYCVEPVALVYHEDNYYLMAYSSNHPDSTANYRIDRMDRVEVIEESTLSIEAITKINGVSEYTVQAFKMYGGTNERVTLRFHVDLINPVLDKFGEDTKLRVVDDTTCSADVHVQISPTFFGWLAQFGNKMVIYEPARVRTEYVDHIKDILVTQEVR